MSLTEINVEPGFQIQGVENCYMKDDLAYSITRTVNIY